MSLVVGVRNWCREEVTANVRIIVRTGAMHKAAGARRAIHSRTGAPELAELYKASTNSNDRRPSRPVINGSRFSMIA